MLRNEVVKGGEIPFNFLALFPRSEERADQRSVVGVSKHRCALTVMSLH